MNDDELRNAVPIVIGILQRRGADFATAEDAVQDALIEAFRTWPENEPRHMQGWLITVAWRKFLDRVRAESSRSAREEHACALDTDAATTSADDTVDLYFLCAHPDLSPASAVALTLRAVGGLTTRQIAEAYLVPEATMAQRISRAKRTLAGRRLNRPGSISAVLTVLYLVFNEGYSGDVDLAAEAIRLTRVLVASIDHPEVSGLLALMLIHHARREARFSADGGLITLGEQDRSRWDSHLIAEGIGILQTALARDELGEFQVQAAIGALHADAQRVEDTDWPQIVEWYDELLRFHDSPIASLNRAVAIGEADGPAAGLAQLDRLDETLPRYFAVEA
ncbi:MAG: RNA polymerase subunit sigma-24, partial [Brevibacterium sp.]|nr:RNA polymerase subunit sigma-24 [Brevibacterium sp.]